MKLKSHSDHSGSGGSVVMWQEGQRKYHNSGIKSFSLPRRHRKRVSCGLKNTGQNLIFSLFSLADTYRDARQGGKDRTLSSEPGKGDPGSWRVWWKSRWGGSNTAKTLRRELSFRCHPGWDWLLLVPVQTQQNCRCSCPSAEWGAAKFPNSATL